MAHLSSESTSRKSNFELLRLICMFFIILHHFVVHGLDSAGYSHSDYTHQGIILNSFVVIAVNCFILISGYFKIKTSWKSFFHLYITCVFYNLLFTFIFSGFNIHEVLLSFLPFSHSNKLWFIQNYFYLFLIAPMLNKVIETCSKKEFIIIIILWSILTFYFGFLWKGDFNINGYNIMNFIFLYLIGGSIARHNKGINIQKERLVSISIYIIMSISMIGILLILFHFNINKAGIAFKYNSPLAIISAISFFLFFRTFTFHSKIINWLSSSSLAIYLIHENSFISPHIYNFINEMGQQIKNEWLLTIYFLSFALVIMTSCILIDKIRMLITNPIEKLFNKIRLDEYSGNIISKISSIIK